MANLSLEKITYAQCRALAESVKGSPQGHRALKIMRPPGLGFHRARPPAALILYAAAREGRLLANADGAAVVIEPPVARKDEWAAFAPGPRSLNFMIRNWEHVTLAAPFIAVSSTAVPMALLWHRTAIAALVLILAAVIYTAIAMIVGALRSSVDIARFATGGSRSGEGPIGSRLLGHHWTISLCHVQDPQQLVRLLPASLRRATSLTAMLASDPAFKTVLLAFRASCLTYPGAEAELGRFRQSKHLPLRVRRISRRASSNYGSYGVGH